MYACFDFAFPFFFFFLGGAREGGWGDVRILAFIYLMGKKGKGDNHMQFGIGRNYWQC